MLIWFGAIQVYSTLAYCCLVDELMIRSFYRPARLISDFFIGLLCDLYWGLGRQHITPAVFLLPMQIAQFGSAIVLYRKARKVADAAAEAIAEDQGKYNVRWNEILSSYGQELDKVEEAASTLERTIRRRLSVAEVAFVKTRALLGGPKHPADAGCTQPTRNIDQSFSDAMEAHPDFQEWVGDLAEQSGGEHINSGLKKPERSLQKVRRAYADDASRLCDVVRVSIVFESPASLATCLRLIAEQEKMIPSSHYHLWSLSVGYLA